MNKEIRVEDVKKAYIKLKSDIYHSNNIIYKNLIAEFEFRDEKDFVFEQVRKIYNGDKTLLREKIAEINIIALPKKVESYKEKKEIVYNFNDDKSIQSLNFFIDAPIEIFILDVLWTLEIGVICSNRDKINKNVIYGNVLSDYKIFQLEYENATFFEPYFYKYSEWRNNAFSKIQKFNSETDLVLINYDIKQYFYNYQVNFYELAEFLDIDMSYQFEMLKEIYEKYFSLLKSYKNIKYYSNRYPLPIGLYSSKIISNIALFRYDNYIEKMINEKGYYGRYVDDMILVLPINGKDLKENEKIGIEKIIEHTFRFLEVKDDAFFIPEQFTLLSNEFTLSSSMINDEYEQGTLNFKYSALQLEINPEKIDIYYFKKNNENITEELFRNNILMRVSDVGYYIEDKITEKTIINDLFNYKNSKYVNKISDLKDTSIDKYGLSIMLTKMINYYKNISTKDIKIESKYIPSKIIGFLSKSDGLKYYQYWEKIFNLLCIFGKKFVSAYYQNMKFYIKNKMIFNLDFKEYKNKDKLKLNVRKDLQRCLICSKDVSLARLNLDNLNNKWIKSLLINRSLISDPFYLLKKHQISKFNYDIDEERISYLPYWVSFEEIYLYESIQHIIGHNRRKSLDEIIEKYCEFNKISKKNFVTPESIRPNKIYEEEFKEHVFETKRDNDNIVVSLLNQIAFPKQGLRESDEEYCIRLLDFLDEIGEYDNYVIGIASLPINPKKINEEIKKRENNVTLKYKRMINHILNEAIYNKVNHLVFPELSIPYDWVKDIIYFSKRHKIQVTFGMQFIYEKKLKTDNYKVYNCICSIYPFKVCSVYNLMYFDLREKKYYSYEEIEQFNNNKYEYNNKIFEENIIVNYKGGYFTNMLCFELTSLNERAKLVDSITNLFVPVLNRDTNYFSSIVNTTARELYCYVALANTSYYGDSRITGPFGTNYKDIVRINGGQNEFLAVGTVNIKDLKQNRKIQFNKRDKNSIYKPLGAGGKEKIIYESKEEDKK